MTFETQVQDITFVACVEVFINDLNAGPLIHLFSCCIGDHSDIRDGGFAAVVFLVPQEHRVSSGPLVQVLVHWSVALTLKGLIICITGGNLQLSDGLLGVSGQTIPDIDVSPSSTSVGVFIQSYVAIIEEVTVSLKVSTGSDVTDVGCLSLFTHR